MGAQRVLRAHGKRLGDALQMAAACRQQRTGAPCQECGGVRGVNDEGEGENEEGGGVVEEPDDDW